MAAAARQDEPTGRTAVRPAPTATVWWARLTHRPGHERSLIAVNSDRFPDGETMDLTAVAPPGRWPAGWLVDVRYRATDGAVVRVDVAERVAAPRERLWFAEVFHASGSIPAVSLLAFSGRAFPPGSVVTPYHVTARRLAMRQRIGEVRWGTRSGVVETVSVEAAHRGQGIGRVLVTAAEGLCMLRGWPGLRSDGELTRDGAAWLATSPLHWRSRLAPCTSIRPADDARPHAGVAALLR